MDVEIKKLAMQERPGNQLCDKYTGVYCFALETNVSRNLIGAAAAAITIVVNWRNVGVGKTLIWYA